LGADPVSSLQDQKPETVVFLHLPTPACTAPIAAVLHSFDVNADVLDRTEDGRIFFPFEAVKVELLLRAA